MNETAPTDNVVGLKTRNSHSAARESENTADISAALVAALSNMRNPHRNRSVEVSTRGGGRYGFRYATLDKILDMARPALAEEGLALFQPITTSESGDLVLLTRLLHKSGQFMETSIPLPKTQGDPQGFGSAVTYLRRYAVTSLLGIAADEDDDGGRAVGNRVTDVTPRPERLRDEASRAKNPIEALAMMAKGADSVEAGTDLIRAWSRELPTTEAIRGKPDWEPVLRHVAVGIRNSLGQVCASAFVRAARMTDAESLKAFEESWGGEWSHTLMMMQEEARDTYTALKNHVAAQTRRVRQQKPVGGQAGIEGGPTDAEAKN